MAKQILQCTTNEAEFDEKLENFISRLDTEETTSFKAYFVQNYVPTRRNWGYCYRVGDIKKSKIRVSAMKKFINSNHSLLEII